MDSSSCPPIDARATPTPTPTSTSTSTSTPTPTPASTSTSNVALDVDAVVHQNKEKDVVPVSSVNVVSNNDNNNDNDNRRKAANGSSLYSSTDDEELTASYTLNSNGEEASSTMEEGDGSDEGGENHAVQDCSSPTTCIDCCNTDNNTVGSSRSNRSTTSSKTVRLSKSNISSMKSLAIQDANIIKVDKLLIEELKHMTAERRNLVQEEIHGVSSCAIPEETKSNSSKSNSEHTADTTTATTDDEDCCNYSSDTITNQENGLKQLDIEIRTIHKEVLFNNLTTHESKDGNTYDEQIWSYLCLNTVDTINTTASDADTDGSAATASASTTTQDQDQQQQHQSSSSATTPSNSNNTSSSSNSKTDNNNNTNNNNSPNEIESRKKRILYSYIYHNDFRLKFLRADMYHARKAAHRYLRCLECLLKYFGPYALQRPLMYNDLCKESQDAIKIGYLQILPSRDRAGRLIVVVQEAINVKTGHNMSIILKVSLYTFLVVSEDIETQKNGVIFIFSTDEKAVKVVQDIKDRKEYALYREGSPVRRSCTHFCLPENNIKMKHIRAIMMLAMSKEERVRIRIHMDGKFCILSNRIESKRMNFRMATTKTSVNNRTGRI